MIIWPNKNLPLWGFQRAVMKFHLTNRAIFYGKGFFLLTFVEENFFKVWMKNIVKKVRFIFTVSCYRHDSNSATVHFLFILAFWLRRQKDSLPKTLDRCLIVLVIRQQLERWQLVKVGICALFHHKELNLTNPYC